MARPRVIVADRVDRFVFPVVLYFGVLLGVLMVLVLFWVFVFFIEAPIKRE